MIATVSSPVAFSSTELQTRDLPELLCHSLISRAVVMLAAHASQLLDCAPLYYHSTQY